MIAVPRSAVACPGSLIDAAAERERERVRAFYANERNAGRSFTYAAYTKQDVRDALMLLFHAKCAYCESALRGDISDPNIEHWRPKGAIEQMDGSRVQPGYHWRASSWDNLLLSCTHCNQKRRHRVNEDGYETVRLGKGELFPLVDPSRVARCEEEESREEPLLLDPCRDDVAGYLDVIVSHADPAAVGLIRARATRGRKRRMAEVTIQVYGLNRPVLVETRRGHITHLRSKLDELREADDALIRAHTQGTETWVVDSLRSNRDARIRDVDRFLADDAPFELVCRAVLEVFARENPRIVTALLDGPEE